MASGNLSFHPDGLDPNSIGRPVYAATVRPSRSLSRTGFRVVMGGCCLVSVVTSIWCVRMGFWPVAGFFGLDMLALYVALSVSARRGRSFEEIVITQIEVLVARVSHRGERQEWRFNPLWTKLSRVEDEEFGLQRLTLVSRRVEVAVARDASPDDRTRVADGIGRALAAVKKGF
ncbi:MULTISPECIES: DUF2244 domain-containing protein [Methylobacterium]|uniref:DUF2244 domain-containing protein n=1 Tax=Methylobacterium jeotgali TaxID=381630 RepID=A0ABQ4T455_9HYPH|nr:MULTISPECIES: DUF2244 domain-containing protein [Methylobacterium]PIU05642.1 MAG: DUF2244 domain-containing protein [Methylobacterium sp. CG09_land_8_20_14_0_10_71_15]PIU12430.1 MAG: DUF2244 domain-containing protein [Methylobacterium sp. CG08_land_8_20_14_0_20_71_15]GBU19789.1 membrane protein [Methylobacterium sp.]GJE08814.1 hypothetical protein AOPFMNJM_4160 [Methylobacterium jeotgali]